MSTTITTVLTGAIHRAIDQSFASQFTPESIHTWNFETRTPTIKDDLAASREVTNSGLISPTGAQDRDGVLLCKGASLLKATLEHGEHVFPGGDVAPINHAGVDDLPRAVVTQFALNLLYPTLAEEAAVLAEAGTEKKEPEGEAEPKRSSKRR